MKRGHKRLCDSEDCFKDNSHCISDGENNRLFKRQFEHVEGNWPSHVYFSIHPQRELTAFAKSCINQFVQNNSRISSKIRIVEGDPSSFHISLSKPFVLRHHQIEVFLRLLHKSLLTCPELPLMFEIYPEFSLLKNETDSRSFITIPVEDRIKKLESVATQGVDAALSAMRQPLYFSDPKFHLSIASWACDTESKSDDLSQYEVGKVYTVDKPTLDEARRIVQIQSINSTGDKDCCSSDDDDDNSEGNDTSTTLCLDTIQCKIGNKIYQFNKIKGFVEI